jgi:hypothetical protein
LRIHSNALSAEPDSRNIQQRLAAVGGGHSVEVVGAP